MFVAMIAVYGIYLIEQRNQKKRDQKRTPLLEDGPAQVGIQKNDGV